MRASSPSDDKTAANSSVTPRNPAPTAPFPALRHIQVHPRTTIAPASRAAPDSILSTLHYSSILSYCSPWCFVLNPNLNLALTLRSGRSGDRRKFFIRHFLAASFCLVAVRKHSACNELHARASPKVRRRTNRTSLYPQRGEGLRVRGGKVLET